MPLPTGHIHGSSCINIHSSIAFVHFIRPLHSSIAFVHCIRPLHSSKDRASNTRTRVSCCRTVFKGPMPQIIFIRMNDECSTPEIARPNIRQEIRIMCIRPLELHIPKIARMTLSIIVFPRATTMPARRTDMPVFARPLTPLTTQISRLVNMEPMFARRKRRKMSANPNPGTFGYSDNITPYSRMFEHGDGHSIYRVIYKTDPKVTRY